MLRCAILILLLFITPTFAIPAPTLPGIVAVNIANAGVTGTTVNKLAKINSSSNAVIAATTDTDGITGVVISNAGTTGSAQIAVSGVVSCVFDGTATASDYVQISSSVAGDCKDTGSTTRPAAGQVIGIVVTGGGGAGTYTVALQIGSSASGTGTVTSVVCAGTTITTTGTCYLAGQIVGTATNDAATAGNFGEYKTATAASSAVSLTTNTAANCVTLSLTAGDWMVSGDVFYVGNAATTVLYAESAINATSATRNQANSNTMYGASVAYFSTISGSGFTVSAPAQRVSLAGTNNVFLIGFMNFSTNTATCGGTINAWRVR